jgi:hypothetical protein
MELFIYIWLTTVGSFRRIAVQPAHRRCTPLHRCFLLENPCIINIKLWQNGTAVIISTLIKRKLHYCKLTKRDTSKKRRKLGDQPIVNSNGQKAKEYAISICNEMQKSSLTGRSKEDGKFFQLQRLCIKEEHLQSGKAHFHRNLRR